MVSLQVFKDDILNENGEYYSIYDIKLVNKINIVIGLSGAGKTYLFDILKRTIKKDEYDVIWRHQCNKEITLIDTVDKFNEKIGNISDNLIVIDEDTVEVLRRTNKLGGINKSNNYFLLLDRTSLIKIDVNVNAVFEFKSRIYNAFRVYDLVSALQRSNIDRENKKLNNIPDIDLVVTEDAESGLLFWKSIFSKVKVPKFKRHSNGEVVRQVKYLLKHYDGNILIILDYDFGAITMRKIMINKRIDKSRLYFMPLESFEEVICNSEFILNKFPEMRDVVINYKEYIDCSFLSTGRYFSALLFNIVKVKSPIKDIGKKNYTKFYDKGMKNFKECFIDDCCAYGTPECKLYYDGDKKKAMLANKFEMYRRFI